MPRLNKRAASLLAWIAISIAGLVFGSAVQETSIGNSVEQRTYDLRFAFRGSLPPSTEAPITLLAIDEESLVRLEAPLMLWHSYFAPVIEKLAGSGAATVGIDFLFSDISNFDPDGQQALSAALLGAGASGMPVVLAYRVGRLGVQQPPEAVRFAALAVGHTVAFANLTTDDDDFVRRQEILAPSVDALEPSFSLAIARAFADKMGGTIAVDDESNEPLLINFRGPEQFERVSFGEAVEAANANDVDFFSRFAGRIVLIGRIGERGDEDFHSTPQYFWSDRSNTGKPLRTPGLEIHANTITTLVEGDPIVELPSNWQLATTLVVAATVALFGLYLSASWALGSSLAFVGGFVLITFAWLFPMGYWLHIVAPVSAAGLSMGSSQVWNYVREGREKRYLRGVFKRYVSDTVIEKILESSDGLTLQGETKEVSVLFADIRNFTSRSEGIPAEQLVLLLNRYFDGMVKAIQSNGGMVDKFIGDGIMALFGAPLADKDAPLNAVKAALDMLTALEQLNRDLVEEGLEPIGIGVGIHTGPVVIGNVGSPERMEYTAIGDVVNTASRIESLTRKFDADILISADTFRAVGESVRTEYRGSAEVKGKAQLVEIYQVLS